MTAAFSRSSSPSCSARSSRARACAGSRRRQTRRGYHQSKGSRTVNGPGSVVGAPGEEEQYRAADEGGPAEQTQPVDGVGFARGQQQDGQDDQQQGVDDRTMPGLALVANDQRPNGADDGVGDEPE